MAQEESNQIVNESESEKYYRRKNLEGRVEGGLWFFAIMIGLYAYFVDSSIVTWIYK
jgi:hypothetical protein